MSEKLSESDLQWLSGLMENGHCGEGTADRVARERLNARINRLLNAARAEARPAVDREAVARVLSPEAFYGVSQWMDRLYLNQIDALYEVQRWAKARFDAKKKADAILALLSPATSPGEEGSSGGRVQAAPDGATETQHSAGWVQTAERLPPYERRVVVLTQMGRIFKAYLADGGAESEEGPCDQWVADEESICPPCWSDGACWSSNADEEPSDQPVAWMPLPAESANVVG